MGSVIVTDDGIRIAYSVWGRRDGTPIVLVQGLGVDGRGWALQRGAFGRKHRCIAPDNRGTGQSDAPAGPYDLARMAGDVVAVLDDAGIERAHVVGASMGGVIAQIVGVLLKNAEHACNVVREAVAVLPKERRCKCGSALSHAIITDKSKVPAATLERLKLIVGKYFENQ